MSMDIALELEADMYGECHLVGGISYDVQKDLTWCQWTLCHYAISHATPRRAPQASACCAGHV